MAAQALYTVRNLWQRIFLFDANVGLITTKAIIMIRVTLTRGDYTRVQLEHEQSRHYILISSLSHRESVDTGFRATENIFDVDSFSSHHESHAHILITDEYLLLSTQRT